MNYLIESILVGFYTCFIYLLFSQFIKNFYVLLLVCGFFKHFFGSSLGLWSWYCNNGEACKTVNKSLYYKSNTLYLIRESIYESMMFLLMGTLLSLLVSSELFLFFMMGIILHILGEYSGIHTLFCKRSCDKIN